MFTLNLVLIAAVVFYFVRSQERAQRGALTLALLLRFAGGLVLGCVYFFYYRLGDTISYFADASRVADLITHDPAAYWNFLVADEDAPLVVSGLMNQVPRALFMVKVTSLISFISANNYWVASLYFSLFAGLTAWLFFRTVVKAFPDAAPAAAVAVLFLPSVVFWGSGITKENVALGSLFVLASAFLKLMTGNRVAWFEWILAGVAFFLAWNLKYYWLAIFMPVVLTSLLIRKVFQLFVKPVKDRILWLSWIFCFLLLVGAVSTVRPNFHFDHILHVIAGNHQAFVQSSPPESIIHFYPLNPEWTDMVLNAPLALVSALFRPAVFDVHTVFQAFAAGENLFVLFVAVLALPAAGKIFRSPHKILFVSVLVYTFVLAIFLALSTPNLGTLVRYRVGFLPFFLLLAASNRTLSGWIGKWMRHLVR